MIGCTTGNASDTSLYMGGSLGPVKGAGGCRFLGFPPLWKKGLHESKPIVKTGYVRGMLLVQAFLPNMNMKVIHVKGMRVQNKEGSQMPIIIKDHLKFDPSIRQILQIQEMDFERVCNLQGNRATCTRISISTQMLVHHCYQVSFCTHSVIK